jgi:excisionase family DNA binding protein
MNGDLLTTGQAAKRCGVTPDTVLKWIRTGRLDALRTAGGHHRITPEDLDRMIGLLKEPAVGAEVAEAPGGQFRYCWEYNWKDGLHEGCKDCIVYKLRAQRCYEMAKLSPQVRPSLTFCSNTCDECDYYRHVQAQKTNVLVVTDDGELTEALERSGAPEDFNVRIADCEYSCSLLVDSFRPDFVVVDCSLGPDLAARTRYHLSQDPRIPFVRIILAAGQDDPTDACKDEVFAILEKPFEVEDLAACVRGVPAEEGR